MTLSAVPKRVRGIIPGSAADFRRREANRLAAERSRSRQHDKVSALVTAAQTLADEKARLEKEISRLEKDGEAAIPGEKSMVFATENTQEAQNTHSRTILAALMSGVDASFHGTADGADTETDEASWTHVENLVKEAESNGRLGELATVAAGQGDGPALVPEDTPAETVDKSETSRQALSQNGSGYNSISAATAMASAVAVAINAEMEKLLRDDLARTRAAIARTEREMARSRREAPTHEFDEDRQTALSLPADIVSADVDILNLRSAEMKTYIETLQAELPALREIVVHMRDAIIEDEKQLASVVGELQALDLNGGEAEKAKLSNILKSIGGYVGNILGGVQAGLPIEVRAIVV